MMQLPLKCFFFLQADINRVSGLYELESELCKSQRLLSTKKTFTCKYDDKYMMRNYIQILKV